LPRAHTHGSRNMTSAVTVPVRPRIEAFLAKIDPIRGRLVFALDATASRQQNWDMATHLQAKMFETVAAIGSLDVQLVYYRGWRECVASKGLSDSRSLTAITSTITCMGGHTQIRRVLSHVRATSWQRAAHFRTKWANEDHLAVFASAESEPQLTLPCAEAS